MAFFDFLKGTNASVDPMGFAGPQNAVDESVNAGGFLNKAGNTFEDPNFQNLLASLGRGIGGQGSAGDVIGKGAEGLIRNKAFQGAASKRSEEQNSLLNSILKQIGGGSLVTPESDNGNFDKGSLAFDGKGGTTLSLSGTPSAPVPFQDVTDPSIKNSRGGSQEEDFSNFV